MKDAQLRFLPLVVCGAIGLAAWLPAGCNSSDSSPGGLEGDWFFCQDDTCAALTSKGIRFSSGGVCASLIAFGDPLGADADYCTKDGPKDLGSYTWDGTTLSIGLDSDLVSFASTLQDNVLRLTGEGPITGEARALRRLAATHCSGTCTEARFEGGVVVGPDGGTP